MVDLEKLALQRDRGYLVRLVVLLVVGVLVSIFLFAWLTGSGTRGCVSETIGGTEQNPAGSSP
jgi:hypothetical protein